MTPDGRLEKRTYAPLLHCAFSLCDLGIVPACEKIVDGFLQRIVFSQRANLRRNNPEKNNYSPSKATPDPINLRCSLYHGLVVRSGCDFRKGQDLILGRDRTYRPSIRTRTPNADCNMLSASLYRRCSRLRLTLQFGLNGLSPGTRKIRM